MSGILFVITKVQSLGNCHYLFIAFQELIPFPVPSCLRNRLTYIAFFFEILHFNFFSNFLYMFNDMNLSHNKTCHEIDFTVLTKIVLALPVLIKKGGL